MGLEQVVQFAAGAAPAWENVSGRLTRSGMPVQMRMIDGALSFPDEEPPPDWHELRVGTAAGMITLRRSADRIVLVVWGNADMPTLAARNALALAWALEGSGKIADADGVLTPDEFRRAAAFPEGFNAAD